MMPVMDGEAFLRVRREDPVLAKFPVIVLTAGGDCRQLQAKHDIAGCRPKTVPLRELIAMIDSCG
jgi:CheY-like chemotaxis protein